MIKNKDRSKWFGASDTHYIMGKWDTKTFKTWWLIKLGLIQKNFENLYTIMGNIYEHKIAKALSELLDEKLKLDRQIKIKRDRVRVNLDSESKTMIYEIKTFKETEKKWKLPESYIQQARVQMYYANKPVTIVAYPMSEYNYKNCFCEIDKSKIQFFEIEQNYDFIKEYKSKISTLKKYLKLGVLPKCNSNVD